MQDDAKQEILEAISTFSNEVDQRFSNIEANMVTKDYLDDKLADLRGDLVVLVRKEDRKLAATLELLVERSVITQDDAKRVLELEPFAQS
jgi:uncharacterized protein YydD (DUF2326 family)